MTIGDAIADGANGNTCPSVGVIKQRIDVLDVWDVIYRQRYTQSFRRRPNAVRERQQKHVNFGVSSIDFRVGQPFSGTAKLQLNVDSRGGGERCDEVLAVFTFINTAENR